jgi:hypothetical protein
MKADRKLYLTRDKSRVVEQGDPASHSLLIGTNGEISAADAKKYGLILSEKKVVLPGSKPAEPEAPDEVEETEPVEEEEEAPKIRAKKTAAAKPPARKK